MPFVTIVVLYVLNKYATDVKVEWSMKAHQSSRFLRKSGVSPEQISTIHSNLDQLLVDQTP